jgi:hypothetical protein
MFMLTNAFLAGFGDKLAYLDPGSGSFLIQLLIAALLGAGIALRASWGKIKKYFGIKTEMDEDDEEADE